MTRDSPQGHYTWLLQTLANLRPGAQWLLREDQWRGSMGCIVCTDQLTDTEIAIGVREVADQQPLAVFDRIYCCACARLIAGKTGEMQNQYCYNCQDPIRIHTMRTRSLCKRCVSMDPASIERAIDFTNQRFRIQPTAVLWQRGAHGVRMRGLYPLSPSGDSVPAPIRFDEIKPTGAFTGGDTSTISVTSSGRHERTDKRTESRAQREARHRALLLADLSRKVEVKK